MTITALDRYHLNECVSRDSLRKYLSYSNAFIIKSYQPTIVKWVKDGHQFWLFLRNCNRIYANVVNCRLYASTFDGVARKIAIHIPISREQEKLMFIYHIHISFWYVKNASTFAYIKFNTCLHCRHSTCLTSPHIIAKFVRITNTPFNTFPHHFTHRGKVHTTPNT